MKARRWEIGLAIAGGLLLLLGAHWIRRVALPQRTFVIDASGCRIPMTILEANSTQGMLSGAVIVLHGLSANRRLMLYLGQEMAWSGLRVYLLDLPGHGDNTDAFSEARAARCAAVAVATLTKQGALDPRTTILVGHSMGGAIAIRMADQSPTAATIAISPAPMVLPRRIPANLLVFSAQYDLPLLKREAADLERAAGGIRDAPEDFEQSRAFVLDRVPRANHTTLLLSRYVAATSKRWILEALLPALPRATQQSMANTARFAAYTRFAIAMEGSWAGLIGLLLVFPLVATTAAAFAGTPRIESAGERPRAALVLLSGALGALAGVLILNWFLPLRFLRLFTGSYLASLLLIVGLVLAAVHWRSLRAAFDGEGRKVFFGIALGLATILAFGAWLNWQLDDAWMNAPRWWRLAAIFPVAWLFCFAEEAVLGPVGKGRKRAGRLVLFLVLRLELWLACIFALYTLSSGQILILLMVTPLALLSFLQRLGADAYRLRTGSATGAVAFSAILLGWFLAAVFPLT